MRWSYRDVMAMPVPVVHAALRFANEYVVKQPDLDDLT